MTVPSGAPGCSGMPPAVPVRRPGPGGVTGPPPVPDCQPANPTPRSPPTTAAPAGTSPSSACRTCPSCCWPGGNGRSGPTSPDARCGTPARWPGRTSTKWCTRPSSRAAPGPSWRCTAPARPTPNRTARITPTRSAARSWPSARRPISGTQYPHSSRRWPATSAAPSSPRPVTTSRWRTRPPWPRPTSTSSQAIKPRVQPCDPAAADGGRDELRQSRRRACCRGRGAVDSRGRAAGACPRAGARTPKAGLMLGRHCDAEGVGSREFRCALLIEDVEFFDSEARSGQQVNDGPGEVAPAENTLLQWVEASLPPTHILVGGQPVLKEVQGPPGLEDPPQLTQCGGDVGDGAQRPGGQCDVVAVVLEGQRLAVQAGSLHQDGGCLQALARQLPAEVRGLDRGDPGDGCRVERYVEARAETDLDHTPRQAPTDPAA